MSRRKKQKRLKNTVTYICDDCGHREEVPVSTIEYWDAVDPFGMLEGPPAFECPKCKGGNGS